MLRPYVTAVDLAARFSALCELRPSGKVSRESNSLFKSELDWVQDIVSSCLDPLRVLLIEDLPHNVPYRTSVRDACRLQGRILHEMERRKFKNPTLFIQPQLWQRFYPDVYRDKTKKKAAETALALGYSPPDLVSGLHGKERTEARKTMTDHVDAYLMGKWFLSSVESYDTLEDFIVSDRRIQRFQ